MPDILESYLTWLKDMADVEQVGEYWKVSLPYLDRHNDYCCVWVSKEDEHHYRLSDDGEICQDFRLAGCDLNEPTRIRTLAIQTIRGLGLPAGMIDQKEFSIVVHSKELGSKLNVMMMAIVSLSQLAEVAVWQNAGKMTRLACQSPQGVRHNLGKKKASNMHDDRREPT